MATIETGGCTKKEATILELAEGIHKALEDLQARLDNRFDRATKGVATGEDRPIMPNILDEIIEKLEVDLGRVNKMASFISSEVLPKIN